MYEVGISVDDVEVDDEVSSMPNGVGSGGGISATTATSSFAIAIESLFAGYQPLMPVTPLISSMSLITQPSGSTGMRLVLYLTNYTLANNLASGLIVTGNTLTSSGVVENVTVLPSVLGQNSQVTSFEYVTVNAWTSITSIAVNSTLVSAGGQLAVKGVLAAKNLISCDFKAKGPGFGYYSPNEKRATMARNISIAQTTKKTTIDGIDSSLYPNSSIWFPLLLVNAFPTITPLTTATNVLKTAATTSPIAPTTSPTNYAPGVQLQYVVSGASTSGTIAMAGVDYFGNSVSETLTCTGNGTYTSTNVYYNVTAGSIIVTGLTGYSININGLGGTNLRVAASPTANPQTFSSFVTTPVVPGQFVQFAVSGNAASATMTITGNNTFGRPISEIVSIPSSASSVTYSANKYSSISSIVSTLATSAMVAINGITGFTWTFLAGNTVYSASGEEYTGADSIAYPLIYLDEGDITIEAEKEVLLTSKGMAQDYLVIGDRSTSSTLAASRTTPLPQPTDLPMIGPNSLMYIDPMSGTPLGTLYSDGYSIKLDIKSPEDPKYTIQNQQTYSRIYRKKREYGLTCKMDFTNNAQYEQFRRNQKQYIGATIYGGSIGGGYQNQWSFIMPARYAKYDKTVGVDASSVDVDVDITGEYDPLLGAEFKLIVICEVPPTYTA